MIFLYYFIGIKIGDVIIFIPTKTRFKTIWYVNQRRKQERPTQISMTWMLKEEIREAPYLEFMIKRKFVLSLFLKIL